MRSIRNLAVGLLVVGLVGAQIPATQTQPPPTQPGQDIRPPVDPNDIITKTYQFVTAPVSVYDSRGNVVSGLNSLDFELYDNGKLQKITEDAASHPISMVVAVQASSTMEALLPSIRKIGSLFSTLVIGEAGEIAVLAYDHRVQTMTGFTSDANKISDAFKNIKPGSTGVHLNDAARDATYLLRSRVPPDGRSEGRRLILVIIGETRDYGSEAKVRDVMTEVEFRNIAIYPIEVSHFLTSISSKAEPPRPNPIPPEARHLGNGQIGTLTTDSQQNMGNYAPLLKEIFTDIKGIFVPNPMEVYSQYSGGHQYSYMKERGLDKAIADIGTEIHTQYLLTYLPNNTDEGGFHEITVKVLKSGYTVRTRNGYWAAATPQ